MASARNLKWLAAVVIAHPIVPATSEPLFPIMSGFAWLHHGCAMLNRFLYHGTSYQKPGWTRYINRLLYKRQCFCSQKPRCQRPSEGHAWERCGTSRAPGASEKAKRRRFQELNQLNVDMHEGYPLQQSFCGGCWGHTFLVFDWMKFHPSLPTIFLCPFQDSIPFSFMFRFGLIPGSWMTSLTWNEIPVAWFLSDITFLGVGYAEPWIRVPLTCSINIAFGGLTTTIYFVFYT